MRAFVLLIVPFFTACTESTNPKDNANPDAIITSHVDGDTVRQGEPELLTGQVSDADNDGAELNVTWMVEGTEVCADSRAEPDGVVSCDATFETTDGTVTLTVTDPSGAFASASVELEVQTVDEPPDNDTAPPAPPQSSTSWRRARSTMSV